jgi:hypothetical protein
MYDYQLTVPDEFEAFILGIKLSIRQLNPVPKYQIEETKDGTIFFIEFEQQNKLDSFDNDMRSNFPVLFKS